MIDTERRYYEDNVMSNILNNSELHHLTTGKSCDLRMGCTCISLYHHMHILYVLCRQFWRNTADSDVGKFLRYLFLYWIDVKHLWNP